MGVSQTHRVDKERCPDPINVLSVIRHFIDLNIRLDIFEPIQARNPMPALIRVAPNASVGLMS